MMEAATVVRGSARRRSGAAASAPGEDDITGAHGGGPHVNFETLKPNPARPGKLTRDQNNHVYLDGR